MESQRHLACDGRSWRICEVLADKHEQCTHVPGTQGGSARSQVMMAVEVRVTEPPCKGTVWVLELERQLLYTGHSH